MRIIILGIGAIGGTVAAALARSGQEVLCIARGEQLAAIRQSGLKLRCPGESFTEALDCVSSPAEIAFRPDDAILLATKTQHSAAALDALRDAGVTDQPVFCLQNGVENERIALRRFPNVHGVLVMMPAQYLIAGEVLAFSAPCHGAFDIGRFPGGCDGADRALAAAMTAANIPSVASEAVMTAKYGKLVMNLGNISEALVGPSGDKAAATRALQDEGRAVLTAAGIAFREDIDPERRARMKIEEIAGVERLGSSTSQSFARGAASVETDFLNGEIALIARQHGLAAPRNAFACAAAARMVAGRIAPGGLPQDEVAAALGL
ncbi:2-dehydropantoate 2-reductase N-terminal domain-containing protein [Frigidibacter sp. MR17.14]|uniref:ketopantoate reductase family protein n=1 Tax=Frigidibacter sp. MR17.14 TaxID=3126509 RepID=UPI003013001C